jgi:hypothetical protein
MRFLDLFFEKGEPTKRDMTFKNVVISLLISVVLSVVFLSYPRANGINIHSDSILGCVIFGGINFLSYYAIKGLKAKGIK